MHNVCGLLLLTFVAAATALPISSTEHKEHWNKWTLEHNRTYPVHLVNFVTFFMFDFSRVRKGVARKRNAEEQPENNFFGTSRRSPVERGWREWICLVQLKSLCVSCVCVQKETKYAVFGKNLELIKRHNAEFDAGKHTYELALNEYADITWEEFSTRLGELLHKCVNMSR